MAIHVVIDIYEYDDTTDCAMVLTHAETDGRDLDSVLDALQDACNAAQEDAFEVFEPDTDGRDDSLSNDRDDPVQLHPDSVLDPFVDTALGVFNATVATADAAFDSVKSHWDNAIGQYLTFVNGTDHHFSD